MEEGMNSNTTTTTGRRRMTTRGRSPITSTMARTSTKSSAKKSTNVEQKKKIKSEPANESTSSSTPNKNAQFVLLGDKPRGLFECDYCRADLTSCPRVRCATCPEFDLCLDCLATSDHNEMCKSRREFQRIHRSKTEQQQPQSEGKKKKGRAGRKKAEEEEVDDPNVLGYYYGGQWIPIFRHRAEHGYVVADSTRYMLFPPFRGVRDEGNEKNEGEGGDGEVMNVDKAGTAVKESNDASNDVPMKTSDEAADATKLETKVKAESSTDADEAAVDASDGLVDTENSDSNDEDMSTPKQSKDAQPKMTQLRLIDDLRNLWTIEEDLRLLDGILTCGLGNWPEIAEHVNGGNGEAAATVGGKTDKMCMERYLDDFLGRYGHILPPYTMVPMEGEEDKDGDTSDVECVGVSGGLLTSERKRLRRSFPLAEEDDAPGFKKTKFRVVQTEDIDDSSLVWPYPYLPKNTGVQLGDEVARDLWYRSEQSFVRQCSNATSKTDVEAIRKDFMEKRNQNLEGYEAKVLPPRIEDLKSYPGSELAGYMPRRGDFDIEHDNDAEHLIADMEFSAEDSRADQDLKVEVIRIFNSKLDERERRKKFVLDKKLTHYRENQENFQKLPADERHLIHRMRLFERFHSIEEHQVFLDNILKAKRLRKEIAKLQTYRRLGITSLADAEKYELDKSRREFHKMAWMKKEAETKKAEADAARQAKENASDVTMGGLDGGIGIAANQSLDVWKQYKSPNADADSAPDSTTALHASGNNEMNSTECFTLEDKPGFDRLSPKEKELCKRLQLLPQHYLDVKKALISESLAAGILDPSSRTHKGKTFVTVDVNKSNDIIDFVLKAGWISSRPNVEPVKKEESNVSGPEG